MQTQQPPLYAGGKFQDPQWMPITVDTAEPYALCFFLYVHT